MRTLSESRSAIPLEISTSDDKIKVHLHLAAKAVASGDHEYRRAAEHVAKASELGASQRQIAVKIGKPVSTVNGLLAWRKSGYKDSTPFGAISKAKRERARVRPVEQPKGQAIGSNRVDLVAGDRANIVTQEAIEAGSGSSTSATADVVELGSTVSIEAAATEATTTNLSADQRARLITTLEFLATERPRLRAQFALNVEKRRAELGLTWDQLLISANVVASSAILDAGHVDRNAGEERSGVMPDIPEFLRRDKAKLAYSVVKENWHRWCDLILGLDPNDEQLFITECVAPFVAAHQSPPAESSEFSSLSSGQGSGQ